MHLPLKYYTLRLYYTATYTQLSYSTHRYFLTSYIILINSKVICIKASFLPKIRSELHNTQIQRACHTATSRSRPERVESRIAGSYSYMLAAFSLSTHATCAEEFGPRGPCDHSAITAASAHKSRPRTSTTRAISLSLGCPVSANIRALYYVLLCVCVCVYTHRTTG